MTGRDDDRLAVPANIAEAETLASDSGVITRAPSTTPTSIGRYRIDRRLGAGAMGVVYAGYDPELARPVAVKLLKSGGSPERMKREAQALAQLSHPNVVGVYDVGEHDGATYVAMALVDGETLRTWLVTERTTEVIVAAIVKAGRGVEAAHERGIVHRDLKPDNIFVSRTGDVLVGDFGLATSTGEAMAPARDGLVTDLTVTGSVLGTPAYMAPEQFDGEATPASDQFSLCVTAWEALWGARPFTGDSFEALAAAVRAGPPPEPRTRNVPAPVRAAIRRGLAAAPDARHPSISALLAALAPRPRRRWPYVAAAAAVLVTAGTLAFAMRADRGRQCKVTQLTSPWQTAPALAKPALAATLSSIGTRYTATWNELANKSCTAAANRELSEPLYAATMRCLDRRAAVLAWVGEQNVPPLELLKLAEALEPIESCQLSAPDEAPGPELAALQRDLDRAAVQVQHAAETVHGIEDLVVRATKLADPAALAEASYLLAMCRHARGRDATPQLRTAIDAAERARDDRIRTRAAALLAIVAANAGRIAEASGQRQLAASAAPRAADPLTAIAVERATVALAFARRDVATEIEALRRIEQLARAQFGEPSLTLVDTTFSLAGALQRANDPEAAKVLERAIAGSKQLSNKTLDAELDEAALAKRAPAARIPLQEQLLAIARHGDRRRLAMLLRAIGYDYELVGNYDRALEAMRELLALGSADQALQAEALENAALFSYELADRTDDKAVRLRRVEDALAFLEQLPVEAKEVDSVQSIHGRVLLVAGRFAEAIPHLTAALAAAEAAEPQHPYRMAVRSFALAQALWEVGGVRDRDRARALAEQAAQRIPDARAMYAADAEAYGVQLENVETLASRVDAWRRTHR